MSLHQTGLTIPGETGKLKNCNSWAEYETPQSSLGTHALCNGGWYKGEFFTECQSKADCLAATARRTGGLSADGKRLHVIQDTNEAKPFGTRGSTIVGGTPNLADRLRPWGDWRPSMPNSVPTRQPAQGQQAGAKPAAILPNPMQVPVPLPYPVQPPQEWPGAMHTPYAGPTPVTTGGITPTFLPQGSESVWSRLGRNIAQGWFGATGWHIFDFARTVDMFGRPTNRNS